MRFSSALGAHRVVPSGRRISVVGPIVFDSSRTRSALPTAPWTAKQSVSPVVASVPRVAVVPNPLKGHPAGPFSRWTEIE